MQLITNGPDIPDALLQAHEDGRVLFFCGAGISYPAGLPGFDGLVRRVMQRAGELPDATEDDVLRQEQFDCALGLYEHRVQGGHLPPRRVAIPGHRARSVLAQCGGVVNGGTHDPVEFERRYFLNNRTVLKTRCD